VSVKELEKTATLEHAGDGQHHGDGILGEQFETLEQQNTSYLIGMWAFIVQEVLFFGAIFAAYAIYRFKYVTEFTLAHHELSVPFGTLNTFVLLFSSYTMARAVRAAMQNRHKKQAFYLFLTFLFAGVFMVNKYFEYSAKFEHHLFPGGDYERAQGGQAREGEGRAARGGRERARTLRAGQDARRAVHYLHEGHPRRVRAAHAPVFRLLLRDDRAARLACVDWYDHHRHPHRARVD
jgi:hypothetical protein